jgi:hypothetical protein
MDSALVPVHEGLSENEIFSPSPTSLRLNRPAEYRRMLSHGIRLRDTRAIRVFAAALSADRERLLDLDASAPVRRQQIFRCALSGRHCRLSGDEHAADARSYAGATTSA